MGNFINNVLYYGKVCYKTYFTESLFNNQGGAIDFTPEVG